MRTLSPSVFVFLGEIWAQIFDRWNVFYKSMVVIVYTYVFELTLSAK